MSESKNDINKDDCYPDNNDNHITDNDNNEKIFTEIEVKDLVRESVDTIIKHVSNDFHLDSLERNTSSLNVLRKIKMNCLRYSIYHNKRYQFYKNIMLFAFRLPIIILSAFNSFFAVGLDGMIEQKTISIANAVVSLGCGILTSIELLLSLQKKIEVEIETYKNYYKLGMDIYRFIEDKTHNKEELDNFTQEVYSRYQTIVNVSIPINIFRLGFTDELCQDADVEQQLIKQAKEINKELDNSLNRFCLCCL
jgi:hypothetical protein